MTEAKKQTEQHIIDENGEQLLRSRLPSHWKLRPYRPDYGLDFALEVFAPPKDPTAKFREYETLGEHIFIQLKSAQTTKAYPLKLYRRDNVEKAREVFDKKELAGTLNTIRYSLETSELVTIERMGVGVPVLLVIADLSTRRCHFVCLNDYIDKILIPRYSDYSAKSSCTLYVPVANEIGGPVSGLDGLRWYAKRPKFRAPDTPAKIPGICPFFRTWVRTKNCPLFSSGDDLKRWDGAGLLEPNSLETSD